MRQTVLIGSNRWRIGQKGLWSKLLSSFKETQENLDDTCCNDQRIRRCSGHGAFFSVSNDEEMSNRLNVEHYH